MSESGSGTTSAPTPVGRARSTLVSVRAGLLTAVALALGLGTALGAGPATLVAVVGALLFAWGTGAVDADRYRRIAAGSVALVVGGVAAVGGVGLAATAGVPAVGVAALAVGVVAADAFGGFDGTDTGSLGGVVVTTGAALVIGMIFAVVASVLAGLSVPTRVTAAAAETVTVNPIAAFWWLQAGVLAVGVLLPWTLSVLDEVVPAATTRLDVDSLAARFRVDFATIPTWYRVAFVGQFFLSGFPAAVSVVRDLVAARPVLEAIVGLLLLSGYLHALVAAVAVVLVGVLAAVTLARGVVAASGETPVATGAAAAGGVVAVVALWVLGVLAVAGLVGPVFFAGEDVWSNFAFAATVVPSLAAVVAVLLVAVVVVALAGFVLDAADLTGGGFALGAALLFGATLLAADGLAAGVVVAAAAACLLVWDLGVHGRDLAGDLPGVAPTTRSELVHAGASGLVLGCGAVLAVGVGYLLVPAAPSLPGERALVALSLALVSFVAFTVALQR